MELSAMCGTQVELRIELNPSDEHCIKHHSVEPNPSENQTSQWLKMERQFWTRFQRLLKVE